MTRRLVWFLILVTAVTGLAWAQMSQEQIEALQQAVTAIAIRNHSVENLIYDGMTVDDVERVLDQEVVISRVSILDYTINYQYASFHGNYLVFWSAGSTLFNPVVIGHARRGDRQVRHNYVDDVRPR